MNCHMCGQREATTHVLELINGERKSVWLCNICASGRNENTEASSGESSSLASFLGLVADTGEGSSRVAACPGCGYEIKSFQDNNRLGCPRCYTHFRTQVVPVLARYHRHASHLGKVPSQAGGMASQQGEITRLRVALEKSIRGEDYEEAARLRDIMRKMIIDRDRLKDEEDPAGGPS
jgi:protein arginine kinase activator